MCCLFTHVGYAQAQQRTLTLLMDAEILHWLEQTAKPLLESAGLSPQEVDLRIVRSNDINAFVTPDKKIFMFSGLILKAETAEEVISVLAHEIGHLKGKHYFRLQNQAKKLTVPTIVSGLIGLGALAAGSPEVGSAVLLGGQAAATSQMLQYSRSQERQADRIAFDLLDRNGYSAEGLVSFFEKLRTDELLYTRRPPAYLLTHPLSTERIENSRAYLKEQENKKIIPPDEKYQKQFEILQAKLFAYVNSPATTLRKYFGQEDDAALYAQAIALAFQGKTAESQEHIDRLLKKEPQNPFYYEISAQLAIDMQDMLLAEKHFEKALELEPDLPLVRMAYGQVLLAQEKSIEAFPHLLRISREKPTWPGVWHSLGIAYGKLDKLAHSHMALAEASLLQGELDDAAFHLRVAENKLKPDDENAQNWYHDLKFHLKREKEKE